MKLQNRSRKPRRHRPVERLFQRFFFSLAMYNQYNFPRAHNRPQPHAQRLGWHLFSRMKKSGIGLNGGIRQFYQMRSHRKRIARLIEANMPVEPHSKNLQVNSAKIRNPLIIFPA